MVCKFIHFVIITTFLSLMGINCSLADSATGRSASTEDMQSSVQTDGTAVKLDWISTGRIWNDEIYQLDLLNKCEPGKIDERAGASFQKQLSNDPYYENPDCSIKGITVKCLSPEEMKELTAGLACANPRACTLYMPVDLCVFLGLSPGDHKMTAEELLKFFLRRTPRSFDEVMSACTAVHELRHITNPLDRSCATETDAYEAGLECTEQFYSQLCNSSSNGLPSTSCRALLIEICGLRASMSFQSCRCERGFKRLKPCPGCADACTHAFNQCIRERGVEEVGSSAGEDYCASNERVYCQ